MFDVPVGGREPKSDRMKEIERRLDDLFWDLRERPSSPEELAKGLEGRGKKSDTIIIPGEERVEECPRIIIVWSSTYKDFYKYGWDALRISKMCKGKVEGVLHIPKEKWTNEMESELGNNSRIFADEYGVIDIGVKFPINSPARYYP